MSPITLDTVRAKLRNAIEAANPCLSEPEVRAREEQHGITLPDGYRQFLLEVGNGGCGPLLGLHSLEESLRCTNTPLHTRFPWIQDPAAPKKRLTAYEPGVGFADLEGFEDSAFEPEPSVD